ncbi:LytR C-terminal domain-containing protein [Actinokineospora sp. HUAS TT18]|uniref:LytR C-terminal domain-containing protein n=1 Tax=Actinokineospora sp. HUAS TT18 TaxID=3447451 RepID=UPI003F52702A
MTTDPAMRPGKIAGIALIGVAAVATVIGVITLVGGNGDSEAQQPPSSTAASTTTSAPSGSEATSAPSSPTATTSSAAPTTTTAAPAPTTTAAPVPTAPAEPSTHDQPVRVYNNSLETGLAAKAAQDLESHGWQVAEKSNYSQGIIPTTTVYYRAGTDEESAARELAQEFGIRAEERFEGLKQASPGLILIVTKDYRSPSIDK